MNQGCSCNTETKSPTSLTQIQPLVSPKSNDSEPCCGSPAGPPSSPFEQPGYKIWGFVDKFIRTDSGYIPVVKTRLSLSDIAGTFRARLGMDRNSYKVAPGLYAVGSPDSDSHVLVTANYKLTFDSLRKELTNENLWILVLDTRGINVWCAAGKGSFGTEEVINRVKAAGVEKIVSHRELILPQFGATGVSAIKVKKGCGFKVHWGPIQARDIRNYLKDRNIDDTPMRRVTFTLWERIVLIPVEINISLKYLLWAAIAGFVLSGIGDNIFSFSESWTRGFITFVALIGGIIGGAILTPTLLPWLPGRAFSLKGLIPGLAVSIITAIIFWTGVSAIEMLALFLLTLAVSSYLAMNFTGTTPYTSPTGVEKEMRRAIPLQAAGVVTTIIIWVWSGFIG
jgi:hypothetical protein